MSTSEGSASTSSDETKILSLSSKKRFERNIVTLGLFFVAFFIPLGPEIAGVGLRPEDLLLVVLGIALVLDIIVQPRVRVLGTAFYGALLMVWVFSVLATAIGAVLGTATLLSLNPIESGSLTVLKEAELVVLFLVVVRFVRSRRMARQLVATLCLGGTILATLAITELVFLQRGAIVPPQQFHLMGEIFGFTASLAAGRLFFGNPSGWERLGFLFSAPTTSIGILVSGEAGAIVGAVAATGMLAFVALDNSQFPISRLSMALWSALGLIIAVLPIIFVPTFRSIASNQISDIFSLFTGNPRSSTSVRLQHWAERIPEVLSTRPLLGFGQMSIPPGGLDNEYFQRLYYTGLLGLGAYLYLLVTATRTALSGALHDETGFVGGYAGVIGVMIGAGLAKGVFHSMKTSAFFVMVSALVFVLLYRDSFDDGRETDRI